MGPSPQAARNIRVLPRARRAYRSQMRPGPLRIFVLDTYDPAFLAEPDAYSRHLRELGHDAIAMLEAPVG